MASRYQSQSWWAYQVPVVGTALRMYDDQRYWEDYRKNTGFTPRYPGRSYGSYGTMLSNQTSGLYRSAMKTLNPKR